MKANVQAPAASGTISARLQACGIRVTAQRLQIAELLLGAPQHPLGRNRSRRPLQGRGVEVSKATVYNNPQPVCPRAA